jgi:hypothetical protein
MFGICLLCVIIFYLKCIISLRNARANLSRNLREAVEARGPDRMVVELITTYAISTYHH